MKKYTLYSNTIIRHFKNPKNVGKTKNADGVGRAGNLLCGDVMELYLKIKKNRIADVRFQTFGCIVAIANTSLLTTMVKGKTIEKVLKISRDDLLGKLGRPLPPIKIHCSVLAMDALHEALYDYFTRNGLHVPEKLKDEHKRIQQTLKTIEERHKEFVELEKEMLK